MSEKTTFRVVVRDHNSWFEDGTHCLLRECGHKHRTLSGAARCHSALTKKLPDGSYGADWHHALVEDSTGKQFGYMDLCDSLGIDY